MFLFFRAWFPLSHNAISELPIKTGGYGFACSLDTYLFDMTDAYRSWFSLFSTSLPFMSNERPVDVGRETNKSRDRDVRISQGVAALSVKETECEACSSSHAV
jgi:hypothetical protein